MSKFAIGYKKFVYGFGIPDSPVPIQQYVNSADGLTRKKMTIPEYKDWSDMLKRALSYDFKMEVKCYDKVTVSEDFRRFSSYYTWVHEVQQNPDWKSCQLDKDILSPTDAKIYSPETCAYVTNKTNGFFTSKDINSLLFTPNSKGIITLSMSTPFSNKNIDLGKFDNQDEARIAWKEGKHQIALKLAEIEKDPRVVEVLLTRYK